jgi:adenine-specific DNA glycosylase
MTAIAPLVRSCSRPLAPKGPSTHVHRVANRWGYVATSTPERTLAALTAKLPQRYWIEINERLVPFGKYICTGPQPHCPRCPLLSMCQQVGVKNASAPASFGRGGGQP